MYRERAARMYAVLPWVQSMQDVEIPWILAQVCRPMRSACRSAVLIRSLSVVRGSLCSDRIQRATDTAPRIALAYWRAEFFGNPFLAPDTYIACVLSILATWSASLHRLLQNHEWLWRAVDAVLDRRVLHDALRVRRWQVLLLLDQHLRLVRSHGIHRHGALFSVNSSAAVACWALTGLHCPRSTLPWVALQPLACCAVIQDLLGLRCSCWLACRSLCCCHEP
jgi:hypothetical protein